MNWAIVIPAGIGIAVLLSIALVAIDVSGQISRQEEADEVRFYWDSMFMYSKRVSPDAPPHGCRGRQHDSWGTCIDLVHAIEHQQWLDSPVEKRESPGTTNRSFKPIPLGHEPFPKIERVEE